MFDDGSSSWYSRARRLPQRIVSVRKELPQSTRANSAKWPYRIGASRALPSVFEPSLSTAQAANGLAVGVGTTCRISQMNASSSRARAVTTLFLFLPPASSRR